jgi:hypothetical protein
MMPKKTTSHKSGEISITDTGLELVVPHVAFGWTFVNDGPDTVFIAVNKSVALVDTGASPIGLGQFPLKNGETFTNDFNPMRKVTKFALKTDTGDTATVRFLFV